MNDALRLYVQKITKLPTIPAVAQEILNLVHDELLSVSRLEEIVEKDPAISAKILSVANSAFFGFKTPTTNINNAILRIGFNNVKSIALGISLMTIFDDVKPAHARHYRKIFQHSIAVGMLSRYIARDLMMDIAEEIFANGMLHDIGYLVLTRYFPESYGDVLGVFKHEAVPLLKAEKKVLNFQHTHIGTWLADKWNLPADILDTTMYHHEPALATDNLKQIAVIHVADMIATRKNLGVTDSDPLYPFDNTVLKSLNVSEHYLDDLDDRVSEALYSDEVFRA